MAPGAEVSPFSSTVERTSRDEEKASRGLGETIARNTAFVTSGGTILRALGFLFSVYIIRDLGDSQFGQYSIVLQFVGLFQIFLELGMTQWVMRSIAQDRSRTNDLIGNLIALRLILALIGVVVIPLFGALYGYPPSIVLGIFLYSLSFLMSAFLIPLQTILEGHERLDHTTAIGVIGRVGFFALGGLFLLLGRGYLSLITASLLVMPVQIVYAWWILKRHQILRGGFSFEPRTWPALLRAGLPFGVISLFLTIAFSIDTVMLSWYQPDEAVGWYNVAYGLTPSITFFFTGFSQAIIPSLSKTYVTDPGEVNRWYRSSVKFILIISLPIAVGGMILAIPLIRFLYTDEYLPAAIALKVLIWDIPFIMFASFGGNITTIVKAERTAAKIYGINTAANVLLNLIAIPRYGVIGASIVTVATDLIGAVQFHLYLRRKMSMPDMRSALVRVVAASAVMGLFVWRFSELNLFLLIGMGALIYLACLALMRVITPSEWQAIRGSLRRLLHSANRLAKLEREPSR